MKESGIDHVFLTGIALDFCVAFTAKDAIKAGAWTYPFSIRQQPELTLPCTGFDVVVIEDATRGLADESIDKERKEMKEAGVRLVDSAELPRFGADEGSDEFKRAEVRAARACLCKCCNYCCVSIVFSLYSCADLRLLTIPLSCRQLPAASVP